MAIIDELLKRAQENQQNNATQQNPFSNGEKVHETKAWRDWKGAVNVSDLETGKTRRQYYGPASEKRASKDSFGADVGQAAASAIQRQEANYKSAGATLLLGAADLLNGKKEYQPKVGSWLWRLQEGSEADTGAANKFMEDAKAGRGKVGQLVMDLTSGAVDLASDALLTAATGGASIGGKLAITAGLGAMGARSFGGGAEEAREQGKSIGQQFLTGAKGAAIEMLTEKIGGPFEKAYGASALGKATSNLAERLGKNAGMKFVLNRLGDFAGEASEEMLSDVLNPLADKLLKLDNGEGWKNLWTADGLSQMAYDGLVGGLLGLAGGVAEGLSPGQREALIDRGIDNAMEANRNGRSIANEMEQDTDGRVASAIANSSSQETDSELPFTMGSQEAAEAKSEATQQTTPEETQPAVKQEAGEFNAEPASDAATPAEFTALDEAIDRGEVEEPTPSEDAFVEEPRTGADLLAEQAQAKAKPIGKKTAERMAGAAYLADIAKQRAGNADQAGAGVDTEGWEDTNINPALWNDRKTIERALAQNGVDYNYDPREALWDSETGQYREVDLDLLNEEERNQFLADMKQARLLDAVDNWLDKNYRKIINSKKPGYTVANARAEFQSKLNDFVRWYLANDVDNGSFALGLGEADNREKHSRSKEAGETLREIAEDKVAEARLKGKKRTKTYSKNGFDVTAIGEATYRVVGPGGRESVQVANGIDEAIQKHTDEGSEFTKKAAEQRKAKEAELEKMRNEVIESGENPAQVEGSDGNTYEVTKQFSNEQQTRYEYVVTELDEDGLPSDREARVFQNRASTDEEAVQYAIDNDLFKTDDYSDLTEGSNDGKSGWEEAYNPRDNEKNRGEVRLNEPGTESGAGKAEGSSQQLSSSDAPAHERYRKPRGARETRAEAIFTKLSRGKSYFSVASRGANTSRSEFGNLSVFDGAADCTIYDDLPDGEVVSDATATHEGVHANFLFWADGDSVKADAGAKDVFDAFKKQRSDIFNSELSQRLLKDTTNIYASAMLSEDAREARVAHEYLARAAGGTADCYTMAEEAAELDKVQKSVQQFLIDIGLCDEGDFNNTPTFSERLTVMPEITAFLNRSNKTSNSSGSVPIADNAKEYAYQKKLAGETGVDEEFAKAAMPEDLDGLSERIKSSDNKFYGERKANITKAAESISKNIGKDAATVLPEELADFVGKDFSQASKDIDGFAKEFLTALATEDDGASLKTLADSLPKRIKKSKALKELLGDPENGNVAKMARVLAEAEDAKTVQNAASDLAEMIAKEAEEMPKRLKTLEQWDKNLSKRGAIARFLSGGKAVSQIASVYFGYQRDMINVLQGLDNFDKYGKGYGYELAKKILDANFKSQTALGNAIDHVLSAQSEFEKSGGANKTVELKMLKKNKWESHQISLAEAVDFLHTIRTLQASKVNAWQDITYLVGDEKLTISSAENFNRIMDALTQAVRSDKAADVYYKSFTDGYGMFKDVSKEAIRDASGRTVDMYEDGSYYPLLFAKKGEATAEHDFDFGLDSTKYTQRRVNELGGVISITDPAVRFNSYAHVASNLVARAATGAEVERLNRGGLGKSITGIVEERYGKGATDTVKQYIKDSSNFRQESNTASSLLRKLRLNIQGGALFGNFGSMLKQYPSVYNAAGVLDFDSITHGVIAQMNASNRKRASEIGAIKTRHQGNLDPSVAETLTENSGFKKAMEKLKVLKFAKEGFEIVDSAAIRTIYLASEYQVEVKDNISRDSKEFNDRVMDYFIPAFLQTQPQFEKTLRPYVQTSDSELIRMFGMFKTQPLRNLNTMMRTISEYNTVKEKYGTDSKEFKATEKQLRTTVAGQASASLMFGALGALAKLLYHRRKDLEDKDGNLDASKVMSRVLMNAAEASGGMLVFGDAAVQMAIDMASGGKTKEFYGLSAGAVSSVADALDAITTFTEKPSGYNAKRAAGYIATLFGIPLNNAYAILNSAVMYGKDIAGSNEGNYDDILKYLDAQAKAAKKEEKKAAKEAAKAAEKSGADMLADTAKKNASQSELNSTGEQKASDVGRYLTKPYTALVEAGMSPQSSKDFLGEIDADGNNSVKQAEMIAYYKAHPEDEQYVEAMWNSYGYKTSWEKAKKKAG